MEQTTPRRFAIVSTIGFAIIAAAALAWAKWIPYTHKLDGIWTSRTWPGHDLLAKAGSARSGPSLRGGWEFTVAYVNAVWPAIVAGLVLAASFEAVLPRHWLRRSLCRRTRVGASLAGAAAALPSLLCTCCAAPVTVALRRSGVAVAAALGYWLGNPLLNPAVLIFLALVAPWQFVVTRVVAGLVIAVGVSALIARLAPLEDDPAPAAPAEAAVPRRFGGSFAGLAVRLLPEYALVVFLVGVFRGWLFPLDGSAAHWGVLAVLLAALLGTLVVVPTGGEIPIVQALAAAGVGAVAVGTLLVALPALSIVSMAMVARPLGTRVTLAAAAAVAVTSIGAGLLLAALGG